MLQVHETNTLQVTKAIERTWNNLIFPLLGQRLNLRVSACMAPDSQPHEDSCNAQNLLGYSELGNAGGPGPYKADLTACTVANLQIFSRLHGDSGA